MNKLLAISVALLSLNLYGADMPFPGSNRIFSYSSLEGWGEDGIKVGLFGPRGLRDDDREGKAIIDLAKKVIKRGKFKLNEKAFDSLYIYQ